MPLEFSFYNENGKIRDIIENITDKEKVTRLSEEDLLQRAISTRQSTYLECLQYLGENHPSIGFIKEVLDDFDSSFNSLDIFVWLSSLERILQNTLNHEYDKWQTELKRKKKTVQRP